MADGTWPEPGGWNRFAIEVDDLDGVVARLRAAGVHFRTDIVTAVGGRQALVEDPSGNPVELVEATTAEAELHDAGETYQVHPIGWVESTFVDPADAPNQGYLGRPRCLVGDHP